MGDKISIYSKNRVLGMIPQTVQINGYIKNPGSYNLTKNMYLTDLLFLGSGLEDSFSKDMIFDRVDLLRLSPNYNKRILYKIDIKELINENVNNYLLQPGDKVYVYSKNLFENLDKEVTISGFVNNPGIYEFHNNMSLGDLILLSGGISNKAKLVKAEISRFLNDQKNANIFSLELQINYEAFLDNKNSSINFPLKKGDLVNIFIESLDDYRKVNITGEVKIPWRICFKW